LESLHWRPPVSLVLSSLIDMSFYLGPHAPRLKADSWVDVETAAQAGVLAETAWLELKEAVPATSKGANTELAKDLASLTVDGGTLIVGVRDKTHEVVGTNEGADGLRDRIIAVAHGRISPPVFLDPVVIEHVSDTSLCLVVVPVPASPQAPHMVDDRYWGRSAQGKRALSDAEVERLIVDRRRRQSDLGSDLEALSDTLDPIEVGERRYGHQFMIARPLGYTGRTLSDALGGKFAPQVLNEAWSFRPQWPPFSGGLTDVLTHPDGILLGHGGSLTGDDPGEVFTVRLLLRDDGAIEMCCGGGTRPRDWREGSSEQVVSPGQVLESAHSVLALAEHLGSEYLGFWGEWELAIRLTGLRGLLPIDAYDEMRMQRFHPYPHDIYFRAARASTRDLESQTPAVVERLVGPLLRGLGVARRYLPYESPSDIYQRSRR
jgi:hypothetical protein